MSKFIIYLVFLLMFSSFALAQWTPTQASHATLYADTIATRSAAEVNVAGNMFITGEIRSTVSTNLALGDTNPADSRLHLRGADSDTLGARFENAANEILNLYFENGAADSDFIMSYTGTGDDEIRLRNDGEVLVNGSRVCTETNGLCTGTSSGWMDLGTEVELETLTDNLDANSLFVDNTGGLVGIGTTTPGTELDIVDETDADIHLTNAGASGIPSLRMRSSQGTLASPSLSGVNDYIGGISVDPWDGSSYSTGGGAALLFMHDVAPSFGIVPTSMELWTQDSAGSVGLRLKVTSDGDVGIGNPLPAQALDVTGQIHATGDICTDAAGGICLGSLSGSPWTIGVGNVYTTIASDSVGIGTTTPTAKLDVYDGVGGNARITVTTPDTSFNSWSGFDFTGASSTWMGGLYREGSANRIAIWTNWGIEALTVLENGDVGIGSTNPQANLHVAGTIRVDNAFPGGGGGAGTLCLGFDNVICACGACN